MPGKVGACESVGMTDGPLDQFDPVAVGIGEPGGPEVCGAVGRAGCVRLEAMGGDVSNRCMHVLHLDDEVVEAAGVDWPGVTMLKLILRSAHP